MDMPGGADGADYQSARSISLIDHHCHGVMTKDLDPAEFELLITESSDPPPAATSFFDSQLGLSLRRWCPPVLGLAPHAQPEDYLHRRCELGVAEVNRLLLRAASVTAFLVDTGYKPGELTDAAELGAAAGAAAHTVVRLEQVAEDLVSAGTSAADFPGQYTEALASAASGAVAVKSVAAYRHGFDIEPGRPTANEVRNAAAVWLKDWDGGHQPRLRSPALLRFLLWSAIDLGLPLQIHAGFGDRDLDLHRCNPLLMTGFIRAAQPAGVPLLFLHCYPYHREAGYLAQVYPHVYCDVGLALNFTGARAHAVLAESLELMPFGKALYSSDAFGLPELHFLGAVVFRRAFERVTQEWLRDGLLTAEDAARIGGMIGAGNARRVYRLPDPGQ